VADIVALARALERDERRASGASTWAEREVARVMAGSPADPAAVGLAWLEAVKSENADIRSLHQRAESALHLTSLLVAAAAAVVGCAATLGAFYFDGSGRVNVVSVLAFLVVLPALFLVPFAIAALPGRIVRAMPGFTALAALARATNSSRLVPVLARVLPQDLRQSVALVSGRMAGHQRLHSALQKWAMLRWSQLFALTFQLTAVVASIILVVFTDLAFGWSTTLTTGSAALDAQRAHRITSALAAPWRWAWPDSVPSLALIEESRYFRVASAAVSREDAARLGNWWPFVVMAVLVYGLLPRVITFTLASARLRAAARAAVIAAPGLSAVVRRIHRAEIETRSPEPERADVQVLPGDSGRTEPRRAAGVRAVVKWSGVPASDELIGTTFPGAGIFAAGGAAPVQEDVALARRLGTTAGGDVVILVKAWEPPLMEFIDFVTTLRQAFASEPVMCFVLPIGLDHDVAPGPALPAQVKVWRDKLATVGDPWLRVAAEAGEVRS
jgi:hypothetical protein